jgi:radical SAM enzyme (TIGR01210 family)
LRVLGASLPRLRTLGLETRPNLVTRERIAETLADLPLAVDRLILGFGLECWNDLLRELSVNKGYSRNSVRRAADAIAAANAEQDRVRIEFETYVLLKPPLLTEREAIDEALRTIAWSFQVGASTAAVFMNTIKDATVQGHLAERHDLEPPIRFQTPYLRSAVEVLRRLPPAALARTAVLGLQSGVMAHEGPRGCERCYPFLLGAIYAHTFTRAPDIIRSAAASWCPCRADWERAMATRDASPLHDRAARLVAALAEGGYH